MSATVDSRIVSMKFDNSQFKREAGETLSMLDKLKAKMDLGKSLGNLGAKFNNSRIGKIANFVNPFAKGTADAKKSIADLQNAENKFSTANMEQAPGRISKSWLAMTTVALTAVSQVTSRVLSAAGNWAKSFTIGPIMDGLNEYQTNLKSIQTIQANTDKPLAAVEKSLQELNRYSDQTIYNFSEMARNIGTFTAAGVGLKDATSSIKGIANMAALSGSSSEQASTAMYQLSQSIASGKVGLQDWNSVVNAGMGGKKLQNAIAQTAVAMGSLDKDQVKLVGSMKKLQINGTSFREAIMAKPGDKPWLSSEVLVNTLASLDGRFSRAAMSADTLANGTKRYNSQAEITSQLEKNRAALAAKGVKFTDEQFKSMMKLSDAAFKSATEVKTLGQVFDVAKETIGSGWAATFQNIFGNLGEAKSTFTALSNTINGFINRGSLARNNMLAEWKELGGRTDLIEGLKNAFLALGDILGPIGRAFRDIFPRKTGEQLATMTENFRHFTEGLRLGGENMARIRRTFAGVFAVFDIGVNIIKNVARYFLTLIGLITGNAGGGFLELTGSLGDFLVKIDEFLVKGGLIDNFFTHVIEGRAALFGPIIKAISDLVIWVLKLARAGGGNALGWISDHMDDARRLADAFHDMVAANVQKALDFLKPYAADARALAESFKALMSTGLDAFMEKIRGGFEELGPSLKAAMDGIMGAFGGLGKGGGESPLKKMLNIDGTAAKAEAGINRVKTAMSGSTETADKVRAAWDKIVEVFKRIGDTLSPVGDSISQAFENIKAEIAKGVDNISFRDIVGAINVGLFAGLFMIFRNFGKKFGGIMEELSGVLNSGSGVLNQVTANLKSMQMEVRANVLLKIAMAVGILAASLWVLSTIPAQKLGISLGAVVVMLGVLTAVMGRLSKQADGMNAIDSGKMLLLSASMSALGIAMLSMAAAIALFGNMDTGTIVKGLASIAAIMVVMTASAAIMGAQGGAGLLMASVGILILSAALTALAAAIKLYSMIDTGTLVNGGLKIAAILLGLGLAMSLMSGSVAGAASLFIIAAALTTLAPVLLLFANMDGDQLKMMLIGLGGALLILSAAAAIAGLVAPGLLALGSAILMIGAGVALVGVGMGLFAAGLAVLAASGTAAFGVLAAAVTLFLGMFPFWMQQLDLALQAMSAVIRRQGPPLASALGVVLRALLIQVAKSAPALGRALGALISAGLTVIRNKFPELVSTGISIVISLLKGVRANVTRIVPLAVDIVVRFLNTLANNIGRIINAGTNLIIKFLVGLTNAIPRIQPKATNLVIAFIRAIGNNAQRITLAGIDMVIRLVNGIANGIRARQGDMNAAGRNLAGAIVSGMASGIAGGLSVVTNAARNLASNALSAARNFLGIHSPSREFAKIGKYSSEGFAQGLDTYSGIAARSAERMGGTVMGAIQETLSNMGNVFDATDVDLSPTITPVLDLTSMQKDAASIGKMINTKPLGTVSLSQASAISSDQQAMADAELAPVGGGDITVKVEQTNISPKPISPIDTYRNTNRAVNLAKEALKDAVQ